jgi:hypothetical protein
MTLFQRKAYSGKVEERTYKIILRRTQVKSITLLNNKKEGTINTHKDLDKS